MARAHYTVEDFMVVERDDLSRHGYCRACGGDMAAYKRSGYKLLHYNSHKRAPWALWHKRG